MIHDDRDMAAIVSAQSPLVQELLKDEVADCVLIPLKTTQELREEYRTENVLITRCPVKSANPTISMLRTFLPEEIAKSFPWLRRCAKPSDLPAHLKSQFMNETTQSRHIHSGKANWIYIILGSESEILAMRSEDEVIEALSGIEGMEETIFLRSVPIPRVPPTSQVQAAMWSQHFWPAVYRKNNPLGPHPALITRNTDEIVGDASVWMTLAHQVAAQSKAAGYGESMGACIVQRDKGNVTLVALAADARWHKHDKSGGKQNTGNPLAHAVLRAISMVAQKLVRAENRKNGAKVKPILEYEAFQDAPILDDEKKVFAEEHPSPEGYLCHGLELYLTHEPCVMCSMAMLHSRMGKVIFRHRMPLTGGLCAEDRGGGHPILKGADGGRGLGLFWRRELNWSLIAWEWESLGGIRPLPVDLAVHA